MAHFFDILTTVCRQLNNFAQGREVKSSKKIPEFLEALIYRSMSTMPDFVADQSATIDMDRCSIFPVGEPASTIYMAVATNIVKPSIDSFVNMQSNLKAEDLSPSSLANTAIGIILPEFMFDEETDIADVAYVLRQIYLGILDLDFQMHYAAEPAILRLANSPKIKISMYDVEMMISAICLIYISLSSWFTVTPELKDIVTELFSDEELSNTTKKALHNIFEKYGESVDSLRSAVGNGKLLKLFFVSIDE